VQPLSPADVKPLAERYAELVQELRLGAGEPLLVLPNGDFFPDLFRGDEASLERLVARLSGYAGLEDTELTVRLRGASLAEDCSSGSCGTGACGDTGASKDDGPLRLLREEQGFVMEVPGALLRDPIVLTSRLAVAVASLVFLEREAFGAEANLTPELAEATAVALGFGVLLLEASYLYHKGCGGPQVGRATALDHRSLSILFSLFLAREGLSPGEARKELGTTQRASVGEAWDLVQESPALVTGLRKDLPRIAAGRFSVGDGGSFISRFFERLKPRPRAEDAALAALERGASVEEVAALLGADSGRRGS
jgi:hypothetical protein